MKEITRGRRCDFAVFHLEHEQRVWHGAVCGRLRTVVIDLDIRHVRHEFDEVQLRQRVALAGKLAKGLTALSGRSRGYGVAQSNRKPAPRSQ